MLKPLKNDNKTKVVSYAGVIDYSCIFCTNNLLPLNLNNVNKLKSTFEKVINNMTSNFRNSEHVTNVQF